jgi:hypothetical protein
MDSHDVLLNEAQRLHRPLVFAQVGEWLKPTDCKSVPPSEVRRFESFPVHQICSGSFDCGRNYESLGDGVDCVLGFGCAGFYHAE